VNLMARFGLVMLAIGAVAGVLLLMGVLPPAALALSAAPLLIGVTFIAVSPLLGRSPAATAKLLASGVPATATLVRYRPTASRIGAQTIVIMTLLVQGADGIEREVSHREGVLPWQGSRLRPGAEFDVRYDAAKPSRVAIDWDA
jgi:hypothetical protein